MRENLKELNGRRARFTGSFEKYGWDIKKNGEMMNAPEAPV